MKVITTTCDMCGKVRDGELSTWLVIGWTEGKMTIAKCGCGIGGLDICDKDCAALALGQWMVTGSVLTTNNKGEANGNV